MSHAVAVLATTIVCFLWFCQLDKGVMKDYAASGYITIDKQAYRIVPVEATR